MIRTLLAMFLLWTAPALGQSVDANQALAHAREGERAYDGGDFAAAAAEFQQAADLGLDHALIHYNLGNARFKSGEVGRAIASWSRALRRNPRDSQARANLEHARSTLRDEGLAPLGLPVFLRPVGFLYHRFNLDEWGRLGLGAIWAAALLAILGHWGVGARALRFRLGWAMVVVGLACFAAMGLRYRAEIVHTTGVVVSDTVEVRSGPGPGFKLAFEIHEGLAVFVGERREQWVQIHLGGEFVGWVPASDLELL